MDSIAQRRVELLQQLSEQAAAVGAAALWQRFATQFRLPDDPGAVFELMAALNRACTIGKGGCPQLPLAMSTAATLVANHERFLRTSGLRRELGNRRNGVGFHAGLVGDFPLLASFTTPPFEEVESRVAGLHFMVLAALTLSMEVGLAAIVVADAARKARNNETWRTVVIKLPDPHSSGEQWLVAMAAFVRGGESAYKIAPAIREFYAAVGSLIELITQSRHRPTPQQSLLPDEELSGELQLMPSARARTPRAARERREDLDERGRHDRAQLRLDDGPFPSGQEPAVVEVHHEAATGEAEMPAPEAVASQSARLASFRLLEIEQTLRWSWDHLNSFELDLLAEAIRQDLDLKGSRLAGATLAALVLALGLPATEVPRLPLANRMSMRGIDPHGRWVRPVYRPAKSWSVPDAARRLVRDHAGSLALALPLSLQLALASLGQGRPGAETISALLDIAPDRAIDTLSSWLDSLRELHPAARLTHGRLARALRVEAVALARNDAAVHFLVATQEDIAPMASYYTAVSTARLEDVYTAAVTKLFRMDGGERPPSPVDRQTRFVGSQMSVQSEGLRAFAEHLAQGVTDTQPHDFAAAHNAYALYCLWLLMSATGHRPVLDPFESRDLFDLRDGWFIAADKQVRSPDEARLIPLPSLAIEVLGLYLEHLRSLALAVEGTAPSLAARIRTAVAERRQRALPLFFLLDDNLQEERISGEALTESLGPLAGLQANFNRHVLSSLEAASGASVELLREMLGHIEHSQPALGPQSPLSPADFEPLRAVLEAHLRNHGWQALPSPLASVRRQPTNAMPSVPQAIELGTQRRKRSIERSMTAIRQRIHEALKKQLRRKPLAKLEQKDVDAVFATILAGKYRPTTLVELDACRRAHRVLAWARRRYSLTLKLPGSFARLPLPVPAFGIEALNNARRGQDLEAAFADVLFDRARSLRQLAASAGRTVAEAVVSLAVHSLVSDVSTLLAMCRKSEFTLLDAGSLGLLAQLAEPGNGESPMYRRYRLHPLSALLLSRLSARVDEDRSAPNRLGETRDLIQTLRARLEGDHVDPFTDERTALRWLSQCVSARARLALPGHLAGHLEGSTGGVGLPPSDWIRLLTGKPAREAVRLLRSEPLAAGEASNESAPERPLPCLPRSPDDVTLAQARASGLALHRKVNKLIHARVRRLGTAANTEPANRSRNQKEHLIPDLLALLERDTQAPDISRALVQWLLHLMQHGAAGQELRAASCVRYYYALAPRMIDALAALQFTEINDDALACAYGEFLDTVPEIGQHYALGRLQEFHSHLMIQQGLPPVEWAEVASLGLLRATNIDAGFLTWGEYETALALLLDDEGADQRTRLLQAFVWVLVFRFGVRVSEAMGLRRKDIVWRGDQLIVLLRPNDYREIKTDAGIRQVPLIGPLSKTERRIVDGWTEHIDEMASCDRMAALFGDRDRPRALMDRNGICSRITQTLRAVTGEARMRIHHGRHSFASRLECLMSLESLPREEHARKVFQRILGPCDPREARSLLLDRPQRSKRGFWAAAQLLGHASPATSQRCYYHLDDVLSAEPLGRVFSRSPVSLDRATLTYAAGLPLPERAAFRHGRRIGIDEAIVRCLHRGRLDDIGKRAWTGPWKPALPPRAVPPAPRLDPALADRALDLAHRRRRLDGVEKTLLMPAAQIQALFVSEFEVRQSAGYDIKDSGWQPTAASLALLHKRAGSRSPAETARVQRFLRGLTARFDDERFMQLTRNVCRAWQARYRADRTPLVLGSLEEVSVLLEWCMAVGMPADCLELRIPKDEAELALDSAAVRRHLRDMEGLGPVAVVAGTVPLARAQYRGQGRQRIGFILRENTRGALTQMNQFHRVMHVLSAWSSL